MEKKKKLIFGEYQNCPTCYGYKVVNSVLGYPVYGTITCPTCQGKGIIQRPILNPELINS
jgi:DnaJ-class molecular chaperone